LLLDVRQPMTNYTHRNIIIIIIVIGVPNIRKFVSKKLLKLC
jgi:hypothetical protein